MSGRRSGKALIQLLYFVARAWLALTTPCGAETAGSRPQAAAAVVRNVATGQAIGSPARQKQKFFGSVSKPVEHGRLGFERFHSGAHR